MRLIDADALPKYTGYALSADEVAKAVENAPTIDLLEIIAAHEQIGFDKGFQAATQLYRKMRDCYTYYCPNCGAKMVEREC